MENEKNSERFLTAFNRIEQYLREFVGAKNYMPFYRLMELASKKTVIIKKYEDELRTFADLRNAIVHNRTSIEYVIAEPHIEVVKKIEEIDQLLNQPKTVLSLYKKNVHTFQLSDSMQRVLETIQQFKFTQFPIYDHEEFKGLLTTVGITNWLAEVTVNQTFPKELPSIGQVQWFSQKEKNYRFIAADTTAFEAEQIFKETIGRRKRIEALLITRTGQPNEKLLGIVTPIDLMELE